MLISLLFEEISIPGSRIVHPAPGRMLRRFASASIADEESLCFIETEEAALQLGCRPVGAVVTFRELDNPSPQFICDDPRTQFFRLVARQAFAPVSQGIHPAAVIGDKCSIHDTASVGPGSVLGDHVTLGEGVSLGAGVIVGKDSIIGARTRIYPGVVLYEDTRVGEDCIIHSGTVVGSDGFGYMEAGETLVKIPQVGRVRIGNRVEIGANCTIDRATLDETVIDDDVKIDNLVQIAHNVTIKKCARIAAQSGVAGSSSIGNWAVLAGQAGVGDHCRIGDRVILTAQAGIAGSLEKAGVYSGSPARPMSEQYRILAYQNRLEAMWKKIKELEKKLDTYEKDH
ncbi:UDP-3-O-(3-hydroxymyristoyl)glucosamine N-acyltransferase [Candidatus Mcinerneyibacteriota bacterium]|nr:UDP-3-O-(3-hydroxymyristoyl)glucosamine N-acyltransferase [Candidatus Mcinerneyibacteriota bacterium]